MAAVPDTKPEFSRLLPLERLGEAGASERIAAGPEERAALARRFGLLALDRLEAELHLSRAGEGLVRVTGRFQAELSQACVVSLEPVRSRLEQTVTLLYSEALPGDEGRELVIDPDAEEPPEPIGPEGIDLGEAVVQQFALALEPYPRASGAEMAEPAMGETGTGPAKENPFAVLKGLTEKD